MKQQILNIILLIGLISFSSCTDENEFKQNNLFPDVPEGMVYMAWDLSAAGFDKPTKTRATLSDTDIKKAWAVVFENPTADNYSTDATVREVTEVTLAPDGRSGNAVMTASKQPTFILLIANTSLEKSKTITPGMSYQTVINDALFYGDPARNGEGELATPQSNLLFSNETGELITPIPMSGISQILPKIEKGVKFTNAVRMARVVNKLYVDATAANAKNGFVLSGISLLGTHITTPFDLAGTLGIKPTQQAPETDLYQIINAKKDVLLKDITENTTKSATIDRPVYYYEPYKSFDIIVAGTPPGSVTVRYYKANVAVTTAGNASVVVNIQSVQSNGYATMDEAIAAPAESGMAVEVIILDESHEFVANGQYYLGISNSEFQLYDSGISDIETVATITTNAFNAGIPAPAAKIELISSMGIELISNTISSNSTDIQVKFTLDEGEAVIRTTIGDLSKDLKIKKGITPANNYGVNQRGILLASEILKADITYGNNIGISESETTTDKQNSIYNPNSTNLYFFQNQSLYMPDGEIKVFKKDGTLLIVRFKYNEGFAGSNIYWDGSKLTFDDVPQKGSISPNANYQGLFFNWGSLVAYANTSQQRWTYVYSPSSTPYPDNLKTLSWSGMVTLLQTSVPHLAFTSGNSILSEQYITQQHNPAQNVGDICKYMTDMGWAPPGKWRLPTKSDFKFISGKMNIINNSVSSLYNPNGTAESSYRAIYENL
ncbi:MAG: hypothetical protein ACRCX4_10810, partial [Bacteroidales bacterium]